MGSAEPLILSEASRLSSVPKGLKSAKADSDLAGPDLAMVEPRDWVALAPKRRQFIAPGCRLLRVIPS
jgi:hypothetical protein